MSTTSEKRIIQRVRSQAGIAISRYGLINDNDRILLAVSGGIDSLILLDVLAGRKKITGDNYHFEAIHITIEDMPQHADIEMISRFCGEAGVKLHLVGIISGRDDRRDKSPCFICSWNRRVTIFKKAGELGFNKVALGHHMDDTLETLLMNMIYHGEFSAMPPKLFMFKGKIEIIRPLILLKKAELNKYAQAKGMIPAEGKCPFQDDNKRRAMADIIHQLSGMNKHAKDNLFRSMSRIAGDYLPPREMNH